MISYIKGILAEVGTELIVVEAAQIGYNIRVPSSLLTGLPSIGSAVKIYTYLQVREDAMQLFGFLTRDDLDVFKLLLGVNGVGPKAALGVLSVLSPDDLRFAVLGGDAKAIAKAPGLGAKTAQKVILELKDKLSLEDAFEKKSAHSVEIGGALPTDAKGEAVMALTELGYSSSEALRAVRSIDGAEVMGVEELLKLALKKLVLF